MKHDITEILLSYRLKGQPSCQDCFASVKIIIGYVITKLKSQISSWETYVWEREISLLKVRYTCNK